MKTATPKKSEPHTRPHAAKGEAPGGSPAPTTALLEAPAAKRTLKSDRLIEMLRHPDGASILEITGALGIQVHSARAMISIQSRKRGLTAVLKDGRYRVVQPSVGENAVIRTSSGLATNAI